MDETWKPEPTKPGWYWAMPKGETVSSIVEVKPGGVVQNPKRPLLALLADYLKWLGPWDGNANE